MSTLSLPSLYVANANFVTAQLLVGGDLASDGQLANSQLDELLAAGVTHIVDVRIEHSDADFVKVRHPDMTYLHFGIDDAGQQVPAAWFDRTVTTVIDVLADPASRALTHCHMGINRGPSLGFAVLLAQGWDPLDALTVIRAARPIAYVGYAEDALAWHHHRTAAAPEIRRGERAALARWRQEYHLDVAAVISRSRQTLGR